MKRHKWWLTTSSVVLGALIILVFLVAVPQRGLASGLIAPSAPGIGGFAGIWSGCRS